MSANYKDKCHWCCVQQLRWCQLSSDNSDRLTTCTRSRTQRNKNCCSVVPSTSSAQTKFTNHPTLWNSIERVKCCFSLVITSKTQQFTSSTHTACTIASCHSVGTFSSSIHSCGLGNSQQVSSTLLTVWHGYHMLYTGSTLIRKSTDSFCWREASTAAYGLKTQWETSSTLGSQTVKCTCSPKIMRTSLNQLTTKSSWRRMDNLSTNCRCNLTIIWTTPSQSKTKSFTSWRRELCISQKFSRWLWRVTTSTAPTSPSTLRTTCASRSQTTTTDNLNLC